MAKSRSKGTRGRRRRRRGGYGPWLFGAALVLIIGVPAVLNLVNARNQPGERYPSQGNLHIQLGVSHVPYNSNPPTSGPHTPNLTAWGSYDEPVPDELLVHNMEDGGVILWYETGTAEENEERIAALEDVARGYSRTVIVPREEMPTTYALTAWTRLQRFDDIDEEGMRAFLEAYHGIDHHPR